MTTFLEQYQIEIEKKLQTIDLWLKKNASPFSPQTVGRLLHLSTHEVRHIMETHEIHTLNQDTFFQIMQYGSSPICGYFSRQLNCGFPTYYTVEQISYLYNLDYFAVKKAAKTMGVTLFSTAMLKPLFAEIIL